MKWLHCMAFLCLTTLLSIAQPPQTSQVLPQTLTHSHDTKHLNCGTAPPTAEQYAYTRDVMSKIEVPENSGATAIPIHVFIVRRDDGTGGIDEAEINKGIANLNLHFLAAGMEFYITGDSPTYIDETDYYDFNSSEESAMATLGATNAGGVVNNAANVFFTDKVVSGTFNACGYAYFPHNSQQALRILMDNGCTATYDNGTFVHEFGHWFNLYHTHQSTTNGNTHVNAENVPRTGVNANCTTKGDLLCDTQADPNGSNDGSCNFVNDGNSTQDINGVTYTPDIDNIMSYYSDYCGGLFTAEQYNRMAQALITRQGYASYPLNRPPATVTDPSGVTAVVNGNYQIVVSWNDNANNEFGYVVERSTTSSSSGFSTRSMSGVGQNTETWTDSDVQANTTYWYRVKATNDNPDDYSNVVSITTGLLYCIPGYQSNTCSFNLGIGRVRIQENSTNLIDNNNGVCGPVSNYQATHSANVTAGNSYDFIIDRISSFPQSVNIFIDMNQDGDFDDANEQVYAGAVGVYSGSFTVPVGTFSGTTAMRIRTVYDNTTSSACNYYSFGETEDYGLVVTAAALPVELTQFTARAQEARVKIDWVTASEVNNDYFIVEHATDGRNFKRLAKKAGAGNTDQRQTYQIIDPQPAIGDNYYRLKQVDFDGKFAYSDVQVVNFESAFVAQVYPNPTNNGKITLDVENVEDGAMTIRLQNIHGQILQEKEIWIESGRNIQVLDLDNLPSGLFLLNIQKENSRQTIKFLNQE